MHNEIKIGKFKIPIEYAICNDCKTAFINENYKPETIKYYTEEYENWFYGISDKIAPIKNSFTDASVRIFLLNEFVKIKNKKILDVGCGIAGCVSLMNIIGAKAEGIEPSLKFSKFNKEILNLKVKQGFIETSKFDETYDIITLFETIEHMEKPEKVLNSVYNLLCDNGILFLTTPHIKKSVSSVIYQQSHYFLFSIGSMANLLYKTGFYLEKIMLWGGSLNIIAKKCDNRNQKNYFECKYLEEYSKKELRKYKINIIPLLPKAYKLIFYHFLSMNELKKAIKKFSDKKF